MPQGEAESLSSLPIACHCTMGGGVLLRLCLNLFNSMWFLFVCLFVSHPTCRRPCLVFGFVSEVIVLYAAVEFVYPWEEVISGASYVTILNQKLRSKYLFLVTKLKENFIMWNTG